MASLPNTDSTTRVRCAIHQPNFFPWLGYFDKLGRVDVFVFLDAVAAGKGTWCNRVRIDIQGSPAWISCPIVRAHRVELINEKQIDDRQPWRAKLLRTLEVNYRRAPHYERAMAILEPLILLPTDRLAEYNRHAVRALAATLGIACRFVTQSELTVAGSSTALLVSIVKAVGGDTYLCGGGAGGYQEDALFEAEGVALEYQNFTPVPYGDPTRWLPGLSIIDYLMRSDVLAGAPEAMACGA